MRVNVDNVLPWVVVGGGGIPCIVPRVGLAAILSREIQARYTLLGAPCSPPALPVTAAPMLVAVCTATRLRTVKTMGEPPCASSRP